jgi:hypothetical protein
VAAVGYAGERLLRPSVRGYVAGAAVTAFAMWHSVQMYRTYWLGEFGIKPWNLSWNEESYLAAEWIDKNLPAGTRVGSWNAGVLGYYSHRPVVNLDGLVNDFDYLTFRKENRVAEYIRREQLRYLSDMSSRIDFEKLGTQLKLTEVYSHNNALMRQPYRIYRVDP